MFLPRCSSPSAFAPVNSSSRVNLTKTGAPSASLTSTTERRRRWTAAASVCSSKRQQQQQTSCDGGTCNDLTTSSAGLTLTRVTETRDEEEEEEEIQVKAASSIRERIFQCFYTVCYEDESNLHTDVCEDEDEWGTHVRPEAIGTLCQRSRFSRKELQHMYRCFKQDCPSGVIHEDKFRSIYSQFFPKGADIHRYAHFVFAAFDTNHSGRLTFTELVNGLSILTRGSLEEKLRWTFALYDSDRDGVVSKDQMRIIVSSIYDLLGEGRRSHSDIHHHHHRHHHRDHQQEGSDPFRQLVIEKADEAFTRLDVNGDGILTMNEFMDSCLRDSNIVQAMNHMNSLL